MTNAHCIRVQLYEGVIARQQTTAVKESSSRLGFPDRERP